MSWSGPDAKRYRLTEPQNVIHSAKRFIGQNIRAPLVQLAMTGVRYQVEEGPNQQPIVVVRDRRMTMPEISSNVLLHLKRCAERQLGTQVKSAVITVPANFTDGQRQATKEAGRLAGLEVMRLINEPTAAALAYGFGHERQQLICVFDFGGGTFDVSILRLNGEVFEVLASEGDFFLGGDDLDRALAEALAAECNRILRIDPRPHAALMMKLMMGAEAIKCHLSENDAAEGEIDGLDLPGGGAGSPAVRDQPSPVRGPDLRLRESHDRGHPAGAGSRGHRSARRPRGAVRRRLDADSRWCAIASPSCSARRRTPRSIRTRSSRRAPRSRRAA